MRSKIRNQSKFLRIITSPIRVLSKARDYYVRSMVSCAGRAGYGSTIDYTTGQLPRSFSACSTTSSASSEDLRELIRAASARTLGDLNGVDVNMMLRQQERAAPAKLPKSCSVAMARIDEDSACEFGGDVGNLKTDLMYPRSRSYAVANRRNGF